jgi:hypothetical protein
MIVRLFFRLAALPQISNLQESYNSLSRDAQNRPARVLTRSWPKFSDSPSARHDVSGASRAYTASALAWARISSTSRILRGWVAVGS